MSAALIFSFFSNHPVKNHRHIPQVEAHNRLSVNRLRGMSRDQT